MHVGYTRRSASKVGPTRVFQPPQAQLVQANLRNRHLTSGANDGLLPSTSQLALPHTAWSQTGAMSGDIGGSYNGFRFGRIRPLQTERARNTATLSRASSRSLCR